MNGAKPLARQVALVTGAGHILGRALALAFAGAGASTAVTSRDKASLNQVASTIQQLGGICHPFPAGVAALQDARTVAAEVCALWGGMDMLINCAALPQEDSPDKEANPDLPLWWLTASEACMAVRGGGVMINLGGSPVSAARQKASGKPDYFANKSSLAKLVHASASNLLAQNIRIHALCPVWPESGTESQAAVIAGVCRLALYLCSPEAEGLNSQVLSVDHPSR